MAVMDTSTRIEKSSFSKSFFESLYEMEAGERIWNLQRAFNQREGAGKDDDMPPPRVLHDSIKIGEKEFLGIGEERANELLSEYYDERGWNTEDGKLTKTKLDELGLEDVASDLGY